MSFSQGGRSDAVCYQGSRGGVLPQTHLRFLQEPVRRGVPAESSFQTAFQGDRADGRGMVQGPRARSFRHGFLGGRHDVHQEGQGGMAKGRFRQGRRKSRPGHTRKKRKPRKRRGGLRDGGRGQRGVFRAFQQQDKRHNVLLRQGAQFRRRDRALRAVYQRAGGFAP